MAMRVMSTVEVAVERAPSERPAPRTKTAARCHVGIRFQKDRLRCVDWEMAQTVTWPLQPE